MCNISESELNANERIREAEHSSLDHSDPEDDGGHAQGTIQETFRSIMLTIIQKMVSKITKKNQFCRELEIEGKSNVPRGS